MTPPTDEKITEALELLRRMERSADLNEMDFAGHCELALLVARRACARLKAAIDSGGPLARDLSMLANDKELWMAIDRASSGTITDADVDGAYAMQRRIRKTYDTILRGRSSSDG